MVYGIKSLCGSCSKNCNSCMKTELALKKNLTYIYLNNGDKITNSCNQYAGGKVREIAVNPQEAPDKSINISLIGNLNLAGFRSCASKI